MSNEMKIETIELNELDDETSGMSKLLPDKNIDLIKNLKVSLDVVIGGTEIDVGDLFNLKEKSVVKLDQELSQPIELRFEGQVVAAGELVAVGDNFGIKIVSVTNWK